MIEELAWWLSLGSYGFMSGHDTVRSEGYQIFVLAIMIGKCLSNHYIELSIIVSILNDSKTVHTSKCMSTMWKDNQPLHPTIHRNQKHDP